MRHLLKIFSTQFVSATSLCYGLKVCQSQRQLLLVVTSLDIHNPHVRSTLSLLLRCFYTIHMITCVINKRENSNVAKSVLDSLFCSFFPFNFGNTAKKSVARSTINSNLRHVPSCTQRSCPNYSHSSWILSTHGSLISDVVPNLCWKECLLHLFWNGIEGGGKMF